MNRQIGQTHTGGLDDLTYSQLADDNGIPVLATSIISLSVYADGADLSLANTPSIDGNGTLRYVWAAGEIATLTAGLPCPLLNVRVRWSVSDGTTTYDRVHYADIVAVKLNTRVTDAMLVETFPSLEAHRPVIQGAATSGTTTTIVDTERLLASSPGAFEGSRVTLTTGQSRGQTRYVKAFDAFTGTLTVAPAYGSAVADTIQYEMVLSWNAHIKNAWDEIRLFVSRGLTAVGFASALDGEDFTVPHRHLALAMACESLVRREGDDFKAKAVSERSLYQPALSQIMMKLEESATGLESMGVPPLMWGR